MDRTPADDRLDDVAADETADVTDDVEGHNYEFYRSEARQRAREAETWAREAARAREADKRSSDSAKRA
jgi:hypothetical protein